MRTMKCVVFFIDICFNIHHLFYFRVFLLLVFLLRNIEMLVFKSVHIKVIKNTSKCVVFHFYSSFVKRISNVDTLFYKYISIYN